MMDLLVEKNVDSVEALVHQRENLLCRAILNRRLNALICKRNTADQLLDYVNLLVMLDTRDEGRRNPMLLETF